MKLPNGNFIAESKKPVPEVIREYSRDFKGFIKVYKAEGTRMSDGFILLEDGNITASAYSVQNIKLYQMNALERMMTLTDTVSEIYSCNDVEVDLIVRTYPESLIKSDIQKKTEELRSIMEEESRESSSAKGEGLFDMLLSNISSAPGVTATALVADGFPIFQNGSHVDFEHIAVATEDMVRAGMKITEELQLGKTDQIILETPQYKVVIAPISDMFLCVLAGKDVNLGLVRLMIKNAQMNVKDV
ncbi:distant relative of homeotic protein bithoraxoid [Methanocella sp. CWC-04]|uniref:Distant relative of homeotic protein bithoraxoid n=1 Tax=Methanooceanicella nereidis TaxID=2052831 RepID=A0AAP2REL9_9EURY|nr:roadblock/LC7 domain-containing protein [Methanocella sp. CWC-04]MCD1295938.1 distant relative of homeotic protein bithoraxoid [Methanocella sp. CWC-04]